MKNLVIDSSVAVKWFVPETDSDKALQILTEYETGKYYFIAPGLIHAEYGNIIWKKQVFQGLDPSDADLAVKEFQKLVFTLTPITALFVDAFKIAVKHKRTFYDSLYLALSIQENCKFVTADEKFYNSVIADFPQIILLANWK